ISPGTGRIGVFAGNAGGGPHHCGPPPARYLSGSTADQEPVRSLASSGCLSAWCAASSALASRGRQRPRRSGMLSRKKMIPPKQIQYQVFHCPTVLAAAAVTSAACAAMYLSTDDGTFCSAASSAPTPGAVTSWITDAGTFD